MSDKPYTPSEEDVRTIYSDHTVRWIDGQTPYIAEREFCRFVEAVKRDAARGALDGLADGLTEAAADPTNLPETTRHLARVAQMVREHKGENYPGEAQ